MRRRLFLHGVGVAGTALGFARGAVAGTSPVAARSRAKIWTAALAGVGAVPGLRLTRFEGSHQLESVDAPFPMSGAAAQSGSARLVLQGITIGCDVRVASPRDRRDAVDIEVVFHVLRGRLPNASVAVTLNLHRWSRDAYVLIPGAVYGGNRFASRHTPFPPLATEPSDIGPHVPPIVSDIPRLNNQPGESGIVLGAVDAAVPAIAVRVTGVSDGDSTIGHGFVLIGEQTTRLGSTSLAITEAADRTSATLSIGTPCVRPDVRYALCNARTPSTDRGADLTEGCTVTLRLRLLSFPCPNVQTLFDRWHEARRDRMGPPKLRHDLPLSAAKRMIEERLLVDQWTDLPGFFVTRSPTITLPASLCPPNPTLESTFRTGADGALAVAVPAMISGGADARRRAAAVLDFQLTGQATCGLFHAASNGFDWWDEGDGPPLPASDARNGTASTDRGTGRGADARPTKGRRWIHVARNAEALFLACRQVLFLRKVDPAYRPPDHWRVGLGRVADAFMRLWDRYQQLGQYVNSDSGDLVVGGSTAGALVPAALALTARALGTDSYGKCAIAIADAFYARFVRSGLTIGGAPAALQAPDSRSASGLLESFVTLAETTGDETWFARAAEVAHQLASWVVAWDVPMPPTSTLGKIDARTTGAVLVSAQDKWALPGFAGVSGDALFRLYRATGRVSFLELLRETVHNSSGYVDPEDRRPDIDSKAGWVAGKIPMGDALGSAGDVPPTAPAGTAQAICLMMATDIPSIYVQPDTGFLFPFDHVDARVKQRSETQITIRVSNPTRFEAELRILSEVDADRSRPLDLFPLWGARSLTLAAGATEDLELPRSSS